MVNADILLSLVLIGIFGGTVYGLLAVGLSLQISVCRVLNVTHGEFLMLGAVLTFAFSQLGINPLLAPVIIGPLLFGLGFLLQATLFRGVKARARSPAAFEGNALLAAFGLMYIILNLARIKWGTVTLPSHYLTSSVPFSGINIQLNLIVGFAIAAILGIAVYLFLTRSRLGRAIRATAEDQPTAELMGVNTNIMLALCFGLGALLAGVAGTLISLRTDVDTSIGFNNTVIALIVVTLGGLGSVTGSFIAGIIIGIVSMLVAGLWRQSILIVPVYYAMLMILLLVRPTGILGKK
ncbi:MAG TPA: branched-chain amino acid ABC transporter permease [Dehalococcoidia bacterium]|nr:branched-chain amino acid ABC transporter permease [Dehalococcoidia bacterium]